MLRSMEEERLIKGFEVGNAEDGGLSISHLLFEDDTILFYDANTEQILYIWMFLTCFEAVSGLRVNLGKGELLPVGDVENVTELAYLLYCKVGSLPMIYLGMPLGVALNQWQFGILFWR